jgi:hypothetical protein
MSKLEKSTQFSSNNIKPKHKYIICNSTSMSNNKPYKYSTNTPKHKHRRNLSMKYYWSSCLLSYYFPPHNNNRNRKYNPTHNQNKFNKNNLSTCKYKLCNNKIISMKITNYSNYNSNNNALIISKTWTTNSPKQLQLKTANSVNYKHNYRYVNNSSNSRKTNMKNAFSKIVI